VNHFLLCVVWNVALATGDGNVEPSVQSALSDTANIAHSFSNRVEVRIGESLSQNVSEMSFEYRHSWFSFLSSDLYLSTDPMRGIGVGLSVDPVSVLSFQGSFGLPSHTERIVDEPVFNPTYTYGVRGAFLIPLELLQSRIYVTLSGGKTWVVDTDYNPSGGLWLPRTDDTVVPTTVRKEVRTVDFVELGVGIRF
jgi:hypothetical protein